MKGNYHFFFLFSGLGLLLANGYTILALSLLLVSLLWLFINQISSTVSIICITFFIASYFISSSSSSSTNTNLESSSPLKINGKIITSPITKNDKLVFAFKDTETEHTFLANVNSLENNNIFLKKLVKGASCSFTGTVSSPEGARNPGNFDYKNYLKTQGIDYLLFIQNVNQNTCSGQSFLAPIFKWRNTFIELVESHIDDKVWIWINALVFGDDSQLSIDTIQLFQRWNISHILAISGLHVGLIIGTFYYICSWGFGVTKQKTKLLLVLVLPLYAFIAGGAVSVWRAVWMAEILFVSSFLNKKITILDGLSILLLFTIYFEPFKLQQVSMQFSYLVTISLILSKNIMIKQTSNTWRLILISFISQMTLLPLQISYFYTLNPLSLFINILIIPYFSVFVIPYSLAMSILFWLPPLILNPLEQIFISVQRFVLKTLTYIDSIVYYPWVIGKISILIIFIYFLFFIMMMIHLEQANKRKAFLFGCWMIWTLLVVSLIPYLSAEGQLTVLDVGQGDALILELPHRRKVIMIDAAGSKTFQNPDPKAVNQIEPFLLSRGIQKIDYVILTHLDQDHIGSLPTLLNDFTVGEIITHPYPDTENQVIQQIIQKGIPIVSIRSGDQISSGNTILSVLSPNEASSIENNQSVVIYSKLGPFSFLFTGDIEAEAESLILENYPSLHADVLKVAHHGSRFSTSERWLEQINPKIAIISVGKKNRYGHPSAEVIDNLRNRGIHIARTDQTGAIIYNFSERTGTFFRYIPYDNE